MDVPHSLMTAMRSTYIIGRTNCNATSTMVCCVIIGLKQQETIKVKRTKFMTAMEAWDTSIPSHQCSNDRAVAWEWMFPTVWWWAWEPQRWYKKEIVVPPLEYKVVSSSALNKAARKTAANYQIEQNEEPSKKNNQIIRSNYLYYKLHGM